LLETKEDLVTDLKILMYRHADEIEKLTNINKDTDKQLVEAMQQITDLAAERDLQKKELNELKAASQVIVDMVDPPEEGAEQTNTLLERLQGALLGIIKYLLETARQYGSHVLKLVKSY